MDKDDPDKGGDNNDTTREQSTPSDIVETYRVDTTQWSTSRTRRGVPGKGNTAARRYANVTPKQRDEDEPAAREPVQADPERNARIEADMALAMGFLPASSLTTNAPATQAAPGVAINALMTVSCWRGSKRLVTWSGPTRWNGKLPARFRARVDRGRLQWQGSAPEKNTLRVATDAEGQGGKSLTQWMPPRTTLIVINVVASAQATGSSAIGGTSEEIGNEPGAPGHDASEQASSGDAGAKHAPIDIDALDLASPLGGLTHNPLADSNAGADADKDTRGAGLSEHAAVDAIGSGQAGKPTGAEGSGGDKGVVEGGGEFARAGGVTAEQGGVDGEFARSTGEAFGAEHGAIGGAGERDDLGIRGGGGVLGSVGNVPGSLRPLAETLNILEDANPGKLAGSWLRKGVERFTVRRIRKKLRREASEYARDRVAKRAADINRALRGRPAEEKIRYARRLRWDIERKYFDHVAEGAEKEINRLQARVRRAKTRRAQRMARKEMQKTEKLLQAAKVKPIAGNLPKNHEHAGHALPRRKLPHGYKTKGLRFTKDGYPDFAPYAVKLPNGKQSVKIEYTGSRKADFRAADRAAGYAPGKRPEGYVWHHYQDGTTMQLVPRQLHKTVRHTGGAAHYRHVRGDRNPYKD